MTALERLGALVSDELRFPPATDPARPNLRRHVLDTLGASIAGARTAEGRALLDYHGRAGAGLGADPAAARLASDIATYCALARLSELDDIHLASMTTPGSIVIPATLMIAASLPKLAGGGLSAAITAGYEAMIRLGTAIDGPSVLYRGIWPTYFAAPLGVAAVAASLFELDAPQTAHALALALTLASPGVGHHHAATTTRWLAVGQAAARGLAAARAARAGFTSDLNLLDGSFLSGIYNIAVNRDALIADLRQPLAIEQVSFKPWCAARQTMAATQALREIVVAGIDPAFIVEATALVLPPHLKMIDHGVMVGDRDSFLTSVQYQMARAVLAPNTALDAGQAAAAPPESVRALMGKITIQPDESLLASYPKAWPARVSVRTQSGRHERGVLHVPGDPENPIDVREKFQALVAPVVGQRGAESLQDEASAVIDEPEVLIPLCAALAHACASAAALS